MHLLPFRRTAPRLLASLLITGASTALAQAPAGPVSLVVPYPAGGGSDITARIVAEPLAKALGSTVVVENIGGATGGIAVQRLLNTAADGRMIYQGSQNEIILPPLTIKSTRYQPADFDVIHPITTTRLVLVVRPGLPVRTLDEFVEHARTRGASQPLTYGSPGIGSLYHLIADSMGRLANAPLTHVPYKGGAPLMQDLIGERIDFTVMAFSTTLLPSEKEGRFRIIANLSRDKPRDLQHLPSIADVSAFKDLDYASNAAYYVRKGTPPAVRAQLNAALGEVVSSEAVIQALEGDGRRVPSRMSLSDAEAFFRAEVDKYQRMLAITGFQPLD